MILLVAELCKLHSEPVWTDYEHRRPVIREDGVLGAAWDSRSTQEASEELAPSHDCETPGLAEAQLFLCGLKRGKFSEDWQGPHLSRCVIFSFLHRLITQLFIRLIADSEDKPGLSKYSKHIKELIDKCQTRNCPTQGQWNSFYGVSGCWEGERWVQQWGNHTLAPRVCMGQCWRS